MLKKLKSAIPPLPMVFLSALVPNVNAEQLSIRGSVSSNYLDHGVAISHFKPVANLRLSYDFAEYFYVSGDLLLGEKEEAPILNRGGAITAGFFYEVLESQAIELAFTQKYFVGDFISDWDYSLFRFNYYFNHSLSFEWDYSNNFYGRDFASRYVGLNWRPSMNNKADFILSIGSTEYEQQNNSYRINNVELGIGYNEERWRAEMIYNKVDEQAALIYGTEAVDSGISLTISYAIY